MMLQMCWNQNSLVRSCHHPPWINRYENWHRRYRKIFDTNPTRMRKKTAISWRSYHLISCVMDVPLRKECILRTLGQFENLWFNLTNNSMCSVVFKKINRPSGWGLKKGPIKKNIRCIIFNEILLNWDWWAGFSQLAGTWTYGYWLQADTGQRAISAKNWDVVFFQPLKEGHIFNVSYRKVWVREKIGVGK